MQPLRELLDETFRWGEAAGLGVDHNVGSGHVLADPGAVSSGHDDVLDAVPDLDRDPNVLDVETPPPYESQVVIDPPPYPCAVSFAGGFHVGRVQVGPGEIGTVGVGEVPVLDEVRGWILGLAGEIRIGQVAEVIVQYVDADASFDDFDDQAHELDVHRVHTSEVVLPFGVIRSEAGDELGADNAIGQASSHGQCVRRTTGSARHRELVNRERISDEADVGGAVCDGPTCHPVRHAVPRPVVGDGLNPGLAQRGVFGAAGQPRAEGAVQEENRCAVRVAPFSDAQLPPGGRLYEDKVDRHRARLDAAAPGVCGYRLLVTEPLDESLDVACARLDRRWASWLGIEPELLRTPGVHYAALEDPSRRTYMEFTAYFLAVLPDAGGVVVSAAPDVCEATRCAVDGVEATDTARVSAALLTVAASLGCEDAYECDILVGLASELSLVPDTGQVIAYEPGTAEAVDWDGTVLSMEVDGAIFATSDERGITAWAGIKCVSPWSHDMQVATRPDCRGQGLAKTVTSAATRHMLATGITPYYAYLSGNSASKAVARSLGFQRYGNAVFAETRHPPKATDSAS